MAGGAAPNPFTQELSQYPGQQGNSPDFNAPNSAYAAPALTQDAPYTDEFGWGPKTRISVDGTPDAMREMQYPVRTTVPQNQESVHAFYAAEDADEKKRESTTDVNSRHIEEKKDRKGVGVNPREKPPAETRWTERAITGVYRFMRPFDQLNRVYIDGDVGSARNLNGTHFSMADHRREYDVLGMQPWSRPRNTYRTEPTPWDADMYDAAPAENTGTYYQDRFQGVEVPGNNRAHRL